MLWMYWPPHAEQNHICFEPPATEAIHHWFSRIGIILHPDLLQLYLIETVSDIIGMKSAPAAIATNSCDGSALLMILLTFSV